MTPGFPGFAPEFPGVTLDRLQAWLPTIGRAAVVLVAVVVALVAVSRLLRWKAPRVHWYVFGFPLLRLRMRRSWRHLCLNAQLTGTDRPTTGQLGPLLVKGQPIMPVLPLLRRIRPRSFGATAVILLHPGQVPEPFVNAAEAMAHAWGVHAVRVDARLRGRVRLTILTADPLISEETEPATWQTGPSPEPAAVTSHPLDAIEATTPSAVPMDLAAKVGQREDGQRWVIDLVTFPHWLIAGATQSGKSTLINAAVAQWATRPVALVGIDCKGGMELAPHAPRLSALATDRAEAADILAALVAETQRRMGLCRQHGARNIWQLPPLVRPVPVVVIVDELAELYLVASRADKDEALRATTNLLRLAQLGAALGVHVIVAGQRVGSDFGPGVTALRAQLAGRICLRVNDEETVKMTLGDLYPDAVDAAQQIDPAVKGIAVTTADEAGWIRARSVYLSPEESAAVIAATAHLAPVLPGLTPPTA
ncbi:FtsK/SpoIIIE domain-containing protein [Micromonospora endolithica]|uniref:Cell division protein FtsK n=1 Tax=Micromonospora endolithica TaxID=230091 RepID=A0A3A9Z138_9ACTN|nr:FtsK/SpoIIIE domain-containing protein [Micromonospora endolithica]RKN42091.1 cell division protein FtsK [Micromonospora endolithica]TWJ26336.1 S-DNA-T family DNA segregation ATPase FtsK/SpoIIIE [Micromonospora endolithica]